MNNIIYNLWLTRKLLQSSNSLHSSEVPRCGKFTNVVSTVYCFVIEWQFMWSRVEIFVVGDKLAVQS